MTDYLLDVNALFALGDANHVHHVTVNRWLYELAATDRCLTCPITESGFVRLLMNPVISGQRPGVSAAVALRHLRSIKSWRGDGMVFVADDTTLAAPAISQALLERHLVGYSQVTDFHLLNLAVRWGAKLATLDYKITAGLPPELARYVHSIPSGLLEPIGGLRDESNRRD